MLIVINTSQPFILCSKLNSNGSVMIWKKVHSALNLKSVLIIYYLYLNYCMHATPAVEIMLKNVKLHHLYVTEMSQRMMQWYVLTCVILRIWLLSHHSSRRFVKLPITSGCMRKKEISNHKMGIHMHTLTCLI